MAHILKSRIAESTTSTGTGDITLGGALVGHKTFSDVCGTADTTEYVIYGADAYGFPTGEWEEGIGTYSASNTLTRTTPKSGSAATPVDFSAGTKIVIMTPLGSRVGAIPRGGSLGQVLSKASTNDLDLEWVDVAVSGAIDATPTDGSANAVSSDGVFDALAGKEAAGTASAAISAHVGLADPHAQYALESALGTAAAANTTDFATAAQGAAADAHRVDVNMFGFLNQTETTIAFDHASDTFTLAPAVASWSYYRLGVKYTITGSKTVVLPAATSTTTRYFVFIDATDGTLSQSTSAWTLEDSKVPVAIVTRNSALTPNYLLSEERHTCLIDRRSHLYSHSTSGTLFSAGATLTGPTVGSSTNSAKTCAVAAATVYDEDIKLTTEAIAAGNGSSDAFYTICYRTGAAAWAWERSIMPFKYSGAGAIQYDNAGTMTAATAGAGGSTRWVNYFVVCTNVGGQESILWVPGQAQHASAAAAYAETFGGLTLAGFPPVEAVAIWQFTWDTAGANLGLCRLARTPVRISANVVSSAVIAATVHNGLSGLDGGAVGEYYHLTAAQNTVVGAISAMNTAKLLGRSTAGTGAPEEITLGTNLSFSGTTLNAAGGGGTASPALNISLSTSFGGF